MLPKRLRYPPLESRFSPATEQHITSAKRLHICSERLIVVALSLWLAACNNQKRGLVRSDVDPKETAIFLVAVYEGYLSSAKNSQDARVLRTGKRILILHLESSRPSA